MCIITIKRVKRERGREERRERAGRETQLQRDKDVERQRGRGRERSTAPYIYILKKPYYCEEADDQTTASKSAFNPYTELAIEAPRPRNNPRYPSCAINVFTTLANDGDLEPSINDILVLIVSIGCTEKVATPATADEERKFSANVGRIGSLHLFLKNIR